jgi:hypothetical protein
LRKLKVLKSCFKDITINMKAILMTGKIQFNETSKVTETQALKEFQVAQLLQTKPGSSNSSVVFRGSYNNSPFTITNLNGTLYLNSSSASSYRPSPSSGSVRAGDYVPGMNTGAAGGPTDSFNPLATGGTSALTTSLIQGSFTEKSIDVQRALMDGLLATGRIDVMTPNGYTLSLIHIPGHEKLYVANATQKDAPLLPWISAKDFAKKYLKLDRGGLDTNVYPNLHALVNASNVQPQRLLPQPTNGTIPNPAIHRGPYGSNLDGKSPVDINITVVGKNPDAENIRDLNSHLSKKLNPRQLKAFHQAIEKTGKLSEIARWFYSHRQEADPISLIALEIAKAQMLGNTQEVRRLTSELNKLVFGGNGNIPPNGNITETDQCDNFEEKLDPQSQPLNTYDTIPKTHRDVFESYNFGLEKIIKSLIESSRSNYSDFSVYYSASQSKIYLIEKDRSTYFMDDDCTKIIASFPLPPADKASHFDATTTQEALKKLYDTLGKSSPEGTIAHPHFGIQNSPIQNTTPPKRGWFR